MCLKKNVMRNNTKHFLEQHPDFQQMIVLYFMGWEEQFGKDIYVDIAESHDDAKARHEFYTTHGYKFVDENCFGKDFETVGIIQCYVPEKH